MRVGFFDGGGERQKSQGMLMRCSWPLSRIAYTDELQIRVHPNTTSSLAKQILRSTTYIVETERDEERHLADVHSAQSGRCFQRFESQGRERWSNEMDKGFLHA